MKRIALTTLVPLATLAAQTAYAQAPQPDPPVAPPVSPPSPSPAPPAASPAFDIRSLRILHEKGILSDAEYESAVSDVGQSVGARAADSSSVVLGRWATTFYGFIEADHIYDTTQSFNETAGGAQVERPGPVVLPPPAAPTRYKGEHGRLTFSVRNSRFGFRLKAPETSGVRTSAQLELDLLGNQAAGTEAAFFTSPAVRVRHANLKIETGVVDVLIGQYWHLLGWQGLYHPNTVEIQGVPGQLYGRTPQIRLSKTIKTAPVTVEIAAAILRPPSRDSEMPELQGGVRIALNKWTGMGTSGATATSIMPLSLAVTADYKRVFVPEFSQTPSKSVDRALAALAIDAFVPVIPATKEKKGNSLSLNGEFVTGYGTADLYTGFTGGMAMPSIPNTAGINPPPAYPQNIDNGIVVFDNTGALRGIQWTTYLLGLQYYLPGLDGRMWISGNYSHTQSGNIGDFVRLTALTNPAEINYVSATAVRDSEDWFDVNVFADVASGVRLGAEYANFNDRYTDGVHAVNHRVQLSGFFLF